MSENTYLLMIRGAIRSSHSYSLIRPLEQSQGVAIMKCCISTSGVKIWHYHTPSSLELSSPFFCNSSYPTRDTLWTWRVCVCVYVLSCAMVGLEGEVALIEARAQTSNLHGNWYSHDYIIAPSSGSTAEGQYSRNIAIDPSWFVPYCTSIMVLTN